MKKYVWIIAVVILIFPLSGCTDVAEPIVSDPTQTVNEEITDETLTVTADEPVVSSDSTESTVEADKKAEIPKTEAETAFETPSAETIKPQEKPAEQTKEAEKTTQQETTPTSKPVEPPKQSEIPKAEVTPPADFPEKEESKPAETPKQTEPLKTTEQPKPAEPPKQEAEQPSDAYTQADYSQIISEVTAYAESYKAKGFTFEWKEDMEFGWEVGYFGTPRIKYEGVDGTIELLKLHVDRIYRTGTDAAYGATSDSVTYKVVQITIDGDIAFAVIYGG